MTRLVLQCTYTLFLRSIIGNFKSIGSSCLRHDFISNSMEDQRHIDMNDIIH